MINEQDKQAILNGAYGIARNGIKVKFIGFNDDDLFPYKFAYYNDDDTVKHIANVTSDFNYYSDRDREDSLDIVGLYVNKPEPFDLKRALDGESLLDLRNNEKCWLYKSHKNGDLITEYENTHSHLENIEPLKYLRNDLDLSKCFGMWKEPKPVSNTVTLTLPCPLKEPKDGMWFIQDSRIIKSSYTKKNPSHSQVMLDDGFYFATKEDAQMWLDAMKNNRK